MWNLLLLWSSFISYSVLFLLSTTTVFKQSPNALRIISSLFLLPAAISSVFIHKTTAKSIIILGQNYTIIPIDLRIIISSETSIFIITSLISLIIALFFLSSKKITQTIKTMTFSYLFLLLISTQSSWLISLLLLSLGSIFFSYIIILNSERPFLKDDATEYFLYHRASDIVAFLAIIFIFIQQNTLSLIEFSRSKLLLSSNVITLFFLAIIIRLIPISRTYKYPSYSYMRSHFISDVFVSIGLIITTIKFRNILFTSKYCNYFLIICLCLLTIRSIATIFPLKNNIYSAVHFLFILTSFISAIFQFLNITYLCILMILLLIPIKLILADSWIFPTYSTHMSKKIFDPVQEFLDFLEKLIKLAAETSTNFISPFYAVFLLYRLPQFFVTLIQIPLRFFHNGNLQRSLMFIMVLFFSYYWWWKN